MIVVQEGKQPVVFGLLEGIKFMIVALRALNCDSKHTFPDAVHAIKHPVHPELFRVDAAFLIDHGVA